MTIKQTLRDTPYYPSRAKEDVPLCRQTGRSPICSSSVRTTLPAVLLALILTQSGCGVFNPGKPQWITPTDPDEKHWLVKDSKITGGSSRTPRKVLDHTMFRSVNVIFVPENEKNRYVSKTTWYDPSGTEFRTIRQTHDVQEETAAGEERNPKGTTRVHSLSTKELYDHEPGLWKVELFLGDELARRFEFTIR